VEKLSRCRLRSLARTAPTGVPTLVLGLVVGIAGVTSRWQRTWLGWAWPPIIGLALGLIYSGARSRDPLWPSIISAGILGYVMVVVHFARDEWFHRFVRQHREGLLPLVLLYGPFFSVVSGAAAWLITLMVTRSEPAPRSGGDLWVLPLAVLVGVLLAVL